METSELVNQIKTRLGIKAEDTSSDELLLSYLSEAQYKVKNYCNRKAIPPQLDLTVISIAVDLYNFKNPSNRLVTEEKQGSRTLKYAGKNDADTIVSSYAAELNRYRRARVV